MSDDREVDVERRWAGWVTRTLGGSERQRDDAAIAATRVGLMGGSQAEAIDAAQAAWQRSLEEAYPAHELEVPLLERAETEDAALALAQGRDAASEETAEWQAGREPGLEQREAERALFLLRVVGGDGELGAAFPLTDGETTIGRNVDRDIRLHDNSVSHAHAVISVVDGRVSILDTGSTNGTRVNGHYIDEPTDLTVGDTIALGDAQLMLELDDREAERRLDYGRSLQEEGRDHEALAELEAVMKSEHRFLAGHAAYAAARLWERLGNQAEAIRHYERAIEAGQGDIPARSSFELGKLLALRGELVEAVNAFDEAMRLGDDDIRSAAASERRDVLQRLGKA
jgi:tetratricopeptide (TPR) repeat protein